eukprot:1785977-Ditylum_brightwellii.AAC.1
MPAPATMPGKQLRPSLTQNDDHELAKKCRKVKKDGWLKKLSRCSFCQSADFSVTCCSQHIIVDRSCRYQLKNGFCNYQHIEWNALPRADKIIWSNFVASNQDVQFVNGINAPAPTASEPAPAPICPTCK